MSILSAGAMPLTHADRQGPGFHQNSQRRSAGAIDTPILRRWLAVQEPLIFEVERPWLDISDEWLARFRHHDR
jgi:hypothetical protein